jgi:hypothetical protein
MTRCEPRATFDVKAATDRLVRFVRQQKDTPMIVRCKMRVMEKSDQANYDPKVQGATSSVVKLRAVTTEGNENWSKWTPSGSIELQITNPAAVEALKLGESFYVDFTPAPPTETKGT